MPRESRLNDSVGRDNLNLEDLNGCTQTQKGRQEGAQAQKKGCQEGDQAQTEA